MLSPGPQRKCGDQQPRRATRKCGDRQPRRASGLYNIAPPRTGQEEKGIMIITEQRVKRAAVA